MQNKVNPVGLFGFSSLWQEKGKCSPDACGASVLLCGASVAAGGAAGGGTAGKGPQNGKIPGGKPGNIPGTMEEKSVINCPL